MHICHCFKDFSLTEGGVERHIRYLSKEPLRAGHKVSVVVSRPPGSSERQTVDGIEEFRTPYLFKLFKVPIMPSYYHCLSSINPDIVHVHGTIPNVSDIAILYALKQGKPSLLHYHFDGNAESSLGTLFANIYNYSINSFIVRKASKVITETKLYAETSPVLKHHIKNIEVVPNGVDLERFSPTVEEGNIREKYQLPAGNIIFFAGRLVKYKGLEYIIKAMKFINRGTLLIAGIGQEEIYLKKLVRQLNLNNVKFLGIIAHEDLPKFYCISDVYVVPSITRGENFGIAPLEAMACGVPVITSNLPGFREFIPDDCGMRVEPKDIDGLANTINSLLSDSSLREKMGQAARKNAEKYSWERIAERVLNIYEELLH